MRQLVFPLALIGLLVWAPTLFAQVNVVPEPNILTPGNDIDWPIDIIDPDGKKREPEAWGSVLQLCAARLGSLPEKLNDACAELILEATKSHRQRLQTLAELQLEVGVQSRRFHAQHTQAVLTDQRRQGTLVFWMVLAVVLVGLGAAIAQFVRSFYVKEESGTAEITISNNEFKFRTTWLGALLLGMSMGFLFLYLVFVYPVRFVS